MGDRARALLARNWLPWLPIVLGPGLLIGPSLVAGRALFWGTPLLQFTPWHSYARQVLAAGHLPLWNSALGMGAPLLANYQSALLYPPNWALLILNVAWGQTLLVLLHLVLAAAGMALLTRQVGLGRVAQSVSGLSYALSGYLITRAGFLSINAASAWLPWIVLAGEQMVAVTAVADRGSGQPTGLGSELEGSKHPNPRRLRTQLRSAGLLAITLAMQWLAGHAQMAWYSLVLLVAWMAYRSLSNGGWAVARKAAGWLALAGGVAFLVAAVQLLPTLEYLGVSDRSSTVDQQLAMTYSFWPWRLAGLVAPDLYGNPRDGNYWGYGNYWEDAIYIGVLPAVLACAAILRKRGRPARWFLLAAAGVALLLALGQNTPVFPFLFEYVPSFSLFQAPARWNLLLVFAMALLAGMGAEDWGVAKGRALYWLRLGTAGSGAMLATGLLAKSALGEIQPTFAPALALSGGLLLASGSLALTRHARPSARWKALAVGLVLVDLVVAGRGANPTLPLQASNPRPASESALERGRLYMPAAIEDQLKYQQTFRFDTFQPDVDWRLVRQVSLPNTGLLDGISSVNNFDPILPARYAAWMSGLQSLTTSRQVEFLRHMDVTGVSDAEGNYRPLGGASRAWLVPVARWTDGPERALAAVLSGAIAIDQEVILEGSPAANNVDGAGPEPSGAGGADARTNDVGGSAAANKVGGAGLVAVDDRGPNRVRILVQSADGGWLVLADTWYPGWNAYLDGQPADSYPADSTFRAVWVPAGSHEVVFRYQPRVLELGVALTGLGLVALALLLRR